MPGHSLAPLPFEDSPPRRWRGVPARLARTVGTLLLALSAACGGGARPPAACLEVEADTAGWEVVERAAFGFRIPPGWRAERVISDEHVERWTAGEGRLVTFDLGAYPSTLREMGALEGYSECRAPVGGHPALLVSGIDTEGKVLGPGRKHVVAAAWRDIEPGLHLTLAATTPDRVEAEKLLAMLRTVRLHPLPPAPVPPPL